MATAAALLNGSVADPWAITLVQPAFDLFVARDGVPPVRTWEELVSDLSALRSLANDWDGQGAVAPHPSLLNGALALGRGLQADSAVPADRVIAGANGTVFFEWHGANGYVEVEVTAPDRAEGRWVPSGANKAVEFRLAPRPAA